MSEFNCQPHLFEVPAPVNYLNCAGMAPPLKAVLAAGQHGLSLRARPWDVTYPQWFEVAERLCGLVGQLLNTGGANVALVPSASYGLAVASRNLPALPGQKILVLAQEYPSSYHTWQALAAERGLTVEALACAATGWTEALLSAIDEHTAIVAVPHCHWLDGTRVNVAAVGARAREVGAALVIDASQSLGVLPLDVPAVQPDIVVSVGHKWLFGPGSLGFLYVAPRWQQGRPLEESPYGRLGGRGGGAQLRYEPAYGPGAQRFGVGGIPNPLLLSMAVAGLEQVLAWGPDLLQAELRARTDYLVARAEPLGYHAAPAGQRAPHLLGLRPVQGELGAGLREQLARHQVYVSLRENCLRVAPHLHTSRAHLDQLLAILAASA